MDSFLIPVPQEFSFDLCLSFLKRSPRELLHRCEENLVKKIVQLNGYEILFELTPIDSQSLSITILEGPNTPDVKAQLENYVREWFDLETDLKPFYKLASADKLLKGLVTNFYGYRIVGQPDLFESVIWAVLGQQINLQFAYTLKQRFVAQFGKRLVHEGQYYYLFPQPETIAVLTNEHLLSLQFSRQKSMYVILIAEAFASGELSKEKLKKLSLTDAKEKLMSIKGIGNWTANYALMKTFRHPDAFPLEDAGVHNAIKNLKGMKKKPTLDQVKRVYKKYKGWEAYATLYLWRSLG